MNKVKIETFSSSPKECNLNLACSEVVKSWLAFASVFLDMACKFLWQAFVTCLIMGH